MYIVYKTDAQHSFVSRDVIGLASNVVTVLKLCRAQAKKEYCELNKDQLFNLQNIKQTQGYEGSGEFSYEEVAVGELL